MNPSIGNGLRKALFLDRDGVINEDISYPHKPEQIRFCDGIFPFCRAAIRKGYLLIVVTNQAGVAKGLFTEQDVRALHLWMADRFREEGIEITAFYYCPFHAKAVVPEYRRDSEFRKPNPGMILQAARDHAIDIGASLMIGDKPSDRIALPALRSIIIQSKYSGDDSDAPSLAAIEPFL